MLLLKAIKCGILGIVGQEGASIEYGIAWCSSYFDEMCEWLMRGNEIARPRVFLLKPVDVSMGCEYRGRVRMGDRRFDF